VRINLASAGVWWAVFTIVPLVALRRRKPVMRMPPGMGYLQAGVRQVARTIVELRRYPQTLRFLIAYLLYNDAIQCVIVVAGPFGTEEIHMSIASIALLTLMIQFVAFFGSIGFDYVARAVGTKRAVMISLAIWSAVLVAAYWVTTAVQFFVLGAAVAVVLGGSQALSRSLYSQMIPKGKEAEYFGIYEIGDKGTSWMAPIIFGLALQFTHSYHKGILSLIAFFLLGMLVLARVDVRRGAADAGQ
jgi:UMF1 family MFS transporter